MRGVSHFAAAFFRTLTAGGWRSPSRRKTARKAPAALPPACRSNDRSQSAPQALLVAGGIIVLQKRKAPLAVACAVAGALLVISCGGSDDNGSTPTTPTTPQADNSCQVLASNGSTVVVGSNQPGDPALPEPATGYRTGLKPVYAKTYMVSTSNAYASAAGCAVLKKGGSAADAAVAVQAVLGLTVPEATGMGSGGFMLYYDATAKTIQAYDGRESAPAAATENYLRYVDDATDTSPPKPNARASGRSIGTIGVPRLIERVQKEHGKLAWKDLFGDAISLSTNGFPIGGRLAQAIASNATSLKRDPEATAYFFNADGTPKALGTILKNPAYANTLSAMAAQGADALYKGPIANDIIAKIGSTVAADGTPTTPGKTTLADLAAYEAKLRTPVCVTYRAYWICGAPPPTSGGITVAAAMQILENFDMASLKPNPVDGEGGKPTVQGVHRVSEAERLAYADRDKYVADTDFVPLPGGTWDTMLNKTYMQYGRQPRAGAARCVVADRAWHQPLLDRRCAGQRGQRHHIGRIEHGIVSYDQWLPAEQSAHRFQRDADRYQRKSDCQPRAAGQAPAQFDGANHGVSQGCRWIDG
jgi:gamma-glutamyltranspeptidase/glutathione hydrolase